MTLPPALWLEAPGMAVRWSQPCRHGLCPRPSRPPVPSCTGGLGEPSGLPSPQGDAGPDISFWGTPRVLLSGIRSLLGLRAAPTDTIPPRWLVEGGASPAVVAACLSSSSPIVVVVVTAVGLLCWLMWLTQISNMRRRSTNTCSNARACGCRSLNASWNAACCWQSLNAESNAAATCGSDPACLYAIADGPLPSFASAWLFSGRGHLPGLVLNSGEVDDRDVDSEAGAFPADSVADESLISSQSSSDRGW